MERPSPSRLRDRLNGLLPVEAPGVHDAVTALQATRAGFEALHLSGAIASATALGLPDLGYVHAEHLVRLATTITSVTDVPLVCDADTGYGGVLQVRRTVQAYAAAGVAALHLEDQVSPKRCGHLAGKQVLPRDEAVAKVAAAVAAAAETGTGLVVIARTDALGVEGPEAAITRAKAYSEVGADLVFVEGAADEAVLVQLHAALPDIRLVVNQSEADPTMRPVERPTLAACGVALVLHPVGAFLAAARASATVYEALAKESHAMAVSKLSWAELTRLLGQEELLALDETAAVQQRADFGRGTRPAEDVTSDGATR
jgi:2-methylisocitrate lyase-like PEP mutase family enzyme